ncbi:MAG: hypothetical protein IAI49_01210 [Candidatus Eremiobacteraeota bacterium]|nr:hypothetical protein [Candidatus Eremiobacteraeota bacterium]
MSKKRPDGGSLACPYPECASRKPYVSISGRDTHLRTHHGEKLSTSPESARKRRDRQLARLIKAQNGRPSFKARPTLPPPPHPATPSHVARMRPIDPGDREYLRKRLLYVVNSTWAREFDVTPSTLRDEIEKICRNNFAQLPRKRATSQENARA